MLSKKTLRLGFEQLEPRNLLSGTTVAAATVYVNIPDNLMGQPGGQVVAPVNIDNAAGIRGAEIDINYDPNLLHTDDASVLAGSAWPQGTQVVANVNDSAGTIVVFVSTAEGLNSGSGSLLQVQFVAQSTAPVGGSTAVDLAKVLLNEGEIVPNPQPQPGPDSTDGKITFVGAGNTAQVSGSVFSDMNNNGKPDAFEGIPGVTIVLVDTSNGQQQQTVTDDSGHYEFAGLAADSYTIQEQQPAAFVEGGPNQISVVLTSGQDLSDQNFSEGGLRPQYISNRLFTTLALPVGSTQWVNAIRTIVTTAGTVASGSQSVSTPSVSSLATTTQQSKSTAVVAPAAVSVATTPSVSVAAMPAVSVAATPAPGIVHSLASSTVQQSPMTVVNAAFAANLPSQTKRLAALDMFLASSQRWWLYS